MRNLFYFTRSGVLAALSCGSLLAGQSRHNLSEVVVPKFSRAQSVDNVVQEVARGLSFQGVLGVQELGQAGEQVSLSANASTVSRVLDEICTQEPRYRWTETTDPRVLNLLANDQEALGSRILNHVLSELDIETDDWPDRIIYKLPVLSPELREYLRSVYLSEGGSDLVGGHEGAGMIGGPKPPHFSLHLKGVSVRIVLNAIAIESLDMHEALGTDPRLVSTPNESRLVPTGWLLHAAEPKKMSFNLWCYSLFSTLQ